LSRIIYPEIFSEAQSKNELFAFFTGREPGIDVSGISDMPVYFPYQEHTGHVTVLKDASDPDVADAVVTDNKGVLLGLKVADCVPVLLYDPVSRAMGAVHAGWRGTAKEILKSTVKTMEHAFGSEPRNMLVAIGPAIRWCCYEVGREVLNAIVGATGDGDYHMEKDGKLCLDLQSANKYQALSVKIQETNISIIEECTYCYPDKYFSYRHAKGPTGRQGGFIGMP
jgi:YfiH family protein